MNSLIDNLHFQNFPSLSTPLLCLMIISSSFFGSWHCLTMCSPLAAISAQRHALKYYHLGRLISYSFLGLLAGSFGQFFLKSEFEWLQTLSLFILSSMLIMMGVFSFSNFNILSSIRIQTLSLFILRLQRRFNLNSGFALGFFSGFFPCGWLYTFIIAAISTRSPLAGLIVMLLFTLGTIPALSAVSIFVKKNISLAPSNKKRIAGIILIASGLYALISHFFLAHNFFNHVMN